MAEFFDEVVATLAHGEMLTAHGQTLGNNSTTDIRDGSILAAAALTSAFAQWSKTRSGRAWFDDELKSAEVRLGSIPPFSNEDYLRYGKPMAGAVLGSNRAAVVNQVAEQSGLDERDSSVVLATAAWALVGHLARQNQRPGSSVDDTVAVLASAEQHLTATGWEEWLGSTLSAPPPDVGPPVIQPERRPPVIQPEPRTSVTPPGPRPQPTETPRPQARPAVERQGPGPARRAARFVLLAGLIASGFVLWWATQGDDQTDREMASRSTSTEPTENSTDTAPAPSTVPPDSTSPSSTEAALPAGTETDEVTEVADVVEYRLDLADPTGQTDAAGTVDLSLDTVNGEVCYAFDVRGIEGPHAAHIHVGPAAGRGGITVDFGFVANDGEGCLPVSQADLIAAASRPTSRYLEVHVPNGPVSIRSQLVNPDPDSETAPSEAVDLEQVAHAAIVDGTLVLRGPAPDQETAEAFAARFADVAEVAPVINELRVEPGAPQPVDTVVVEDSVQFGFDSTEVTAENLEILAGVAAIVDVRPEWSLIVFGHTDSAGSIFYNFSLSLRRAEAVRSALIELGVPPLQVLVQGLGPFSPMADNETGEGRAENRRIEMMIEPTR